MGEKPVTIESNKINCQWQVLMNDLLDAYFNFFRQNGYAVYYFVYAVIAAVFAFVKVGELVLDVIKVKRGFYDKQG